MPQRAVCICAQSTAATRSVASAHTPCARCDSCVLLLLHVTDAATWRLRQRESGAHVLCMQEHGGGVQPQEGMHAHSVTAHHHLLYKTMATACTRAPTHSALTCVCGTAEHVRRWQQLLLQIRCQSCNAMRSRVWRGASEVHTYIRGMRAAVLVGSTRVWGPRPWDACCLSPRCTPTRRGAQQPLCGGWARASAAATDIWRAQMAGRPRQ
jgi:hypothetical protein